MNIILSGLLKAAAHLNRIRPAAGKQRFTPPIGRTQLREAARRRRQIEAGSLRHENGLARSFPTIIQKSGR